MRDPQPSPNVRSRSRWWLAALALALGCLNPRPEELPSAQNIEGGGAAAPGLGSDDGQARVPAPVEESPASGGAGDDSPPEEPAPDLLELGGQQRDAGAEQPDAGPSDAGR